MGQRLQRKTKRQGSNEKQKKSGNSEKVSRMLSIADGFDNNIVHKVNGTNIKFY